MNLKTRRLIFYFLIVVFFILAFIIIPYSNGWRFDLKTFSYAKLGGIYLEIYPEDSQVLIGGQPVRSTTLYSKGGILLNNLFPKTYEISVQKNNYQIWTKNITVRPSLVTKTHPIILIPQKLEPQLIIADIANIFSNQNFIIWQDKINKLKIQSVNQLLGSSTDYRTIKGTKFISWLADNKRILTQDKNTNTYFIINTEQNNTASNINLIFENLKYKNSIANSEPINAIISHPSDKNRVIVSTPKSLYIVDFNEPSLEVIKLGQFKLLAALNNEVFFTDSANLYSYNLTSRNITLILNHSQITAIKISPDSRFLAISDDKKLILLDRTEPEIVKDILSNPKYFEFSPDGKKIAATNTNSLIKIFFIGNDYESFNKNYLATSSFDIGKLDSNWPLIWHSNSAYIFVKSGSAMRLLEIDDAPPLNIQFIGTATGKYTFIPPDSLYLIDSDDLYLLEIK